MNHHLQSLGWTLVHFCWQAAAIALAYWLADFALSKTRSQTRYLLALGAMLLMLSCALSTFAYEETHANSELSSPGALSIVANAAGGSSISADLAPSPRIDGAGATTPPPVLLQLSQLFPWLDIVWLFGVACLSIRTIGGWCMLFWNLIQTTVETKGRAALPWKVVAGLPFSISSPWNHYSPLCHPERSRGTCGSTDLSWISFCRPMYAWAVCQHLGTYTPWSPQMQAWNPTDSYL